VPSLWKSYDTEVPGKWVLAGEHTVLRGGAAIALPHPEFSLKLRFTSGTTRLQVSPDLASVVVQDLLRVARDVLKVQFELPRGKLELESTIPFGGGLGSSAALSVAVARWVLHELEISREKERELAREMENRFHGKSSGMDVAVVSMNAPIRFTMKAGAQKLEIPRLPHFQFTDTGIRAATKDCIQKVEALRVTDPEKSEEADANMAKATSETLQGLTRFAVGDEAGLALIAQGMTRAQTAFQSWGLVPSEADEIIQELLKSGALSARLTGAGGGGFIVSLWP